MAPLTLRLLHRCPLALSQWQREVCCASAFPGREACMALQAWRTAFTRGLLGGEREVRGRTEREGEPEQVTTAPQTAMTCRSVDSNAATEIPGPQLQI